MDKLALDLVTRYESLEELVPMLEAQVRQMIAADGCSLLVLRDDMLYDVMAKAWFPVVGVTSTWRIVAEQKGAHSKARAVERSQVMEGGVWPTCVL